MRDLASNKCQRLTNRVCVNRKHRLRWRKDQDRVAVHWATPASGNFLSRAWRDHDVVKEIRVFAGPFSREFAAFGSLGGILDVEAHPHQLPALIFVWNVFRNL